MKRDDLKYHLHAPEEYNVPEARNSSEWAKHQFWTWYLFRPKTTPNPYDGLDYMLLMRWVIEKFSTSHELQFALLYWDLRMPNIIIDGDDNLMAYSHPTC